MNINEKYPYPNKKDEHENILKFCCPSASWDDMTGLVPYAAYDKNNAPDSYNEIYPFLPDIDDNYGVDNSTKKL